MTLLSLIPKKFHTEHSSFQHQANPKNFQLSKRITTTNCITWKQYWKDILFRTLRVKAVRSLWSPFDENTTDGKLFYSENDPALSTTAFVCGFFTVPTRKSVNPRGIPEIKQEQPSRPHHDQDCHGDPTTSQTMCQCNYQMTTLFISLKPHIDTY